MGRNSSFGMSNLRWLRLSQEDAAPNGVYQTNTMIYLPEINVSHQLTRDNA